MESSFSFIEKRKTENTQRYFAICDFCYWSATILASDRSGEIEDCPLCSERLSLIPLNIDETYIIDFTSRGIEMAFAKSR